MILLTFEGKPVKRRIEWRILCRRPDGKEEIANINWYDTLQEVKDMIESWYKHDATHQIEALKWEYRPQSRTTLYEE